MPDNLLQFPVPPVLAPPSQPQVAAPEVAPPRQHAPAGSHLPPDQEARTRALDIQASFIVEAPAGSGKTGLLMQRYLKLLAYAEIDTPEDVLAITFTRKATAELRERILHELREAASHSEPEALAGEEPDAAQTFETLTRSFAAAVLRRDRERNWQLLTRPDRLRIRTIDSVSSEIAASLPLLSGSAAARTPSENPGELYRLAAERTLLQLGGPDPRLDAALHTVLLHRDANLADVRTLLAGMLEKREQWGELVPLGHELDDRTLDTEVRPRLEAALQAVVCAGLNRAARAIPPDLLDALAWLAAQLAHEPGYKSEPSPIQICANKSEPPGDRADHLDHWTALIGLVLTGAGEWRSGFNVNHVGFALPKDQKALLKQAIDEVRHDTDLRDALHGVRCLPPARYPDAQWEVAKALFHLLLRALAELKVLFAEREECDFAELTLAAREALGNADGPADLGRSSGVTLRHLLVDEMQDTSSSQYELIQLLSHSWDGHSQTLFLVGDPKQSIYLFRQARVERFLRAVAEEKLGDIPLDVLNLTANFRSQNTLVEEFNQDFSATFPQGASSPQSVLFVQADPTRAESDFAAGRVWHTCIRKESTHLPGSEAADGEDVDDAKHRADEARVIRSVVERWQRKPLPAGRVRPWSVAVLARGREHLSAVIREFHTPDRAGRTVPFTAIDIERLGEQPEVLDLLALTRALLHPADRVAWMAVLHAPWCGLDLADLLALAGNGAREAQYEAIPAVAPVRRALLSATGVALFDRTWPVLKRALAERGRTFLATEVERTWRSLGGDAPLDARRAANAQLFFTALRKAEGSGGRLDVDHFASAVGTLFAEPETAPNAVTLSTIHKAKGLEWDVVLVPGLERASRTHMSELLNWLELDAIGGDSAQVVLAPVAAKGNDPGKLYDWINTVRTARDAAERKRLFYVACTRAREELHLFAAATRRSTGDVYAPSGTLLHSAWEAAMPYFMRDAQNHLQTSLGKSLIRNESDVISLAASSEQAPPAAMLALAPAPLIHRLPLTFSAATRLSETPRLPYRPALPVSADQAFDRPEGSFGVRAFGNIVHRFLQLVSTLLEAGTPAEEVAAGLSAWTSRLAASLRAEGLPPAAVPRFAERALHALERALADRVGLWILSPHPGARSEASIRRPAGDGDGPRELRTDRTFLAGPAPGSLGDTHLWIVDYKTTEQGSRTDEAFKAAEREVYGPQLAVYASAFSPLATPRLPIMLGLYYPLIPKLLHWAYRPDSVPPNL